MLGQWAALPACGEQYVLQWECKELAALGKALRDLVKTQLVHMTC